jgi:hypothetical protein
LVISFGHQIQPLGRQVAGLAAAVAELQHRLEAGVEVEGRCCVAVLVSNLPETEMAFRVGETPAGI